MNKIPAELVKLKCVRLVEEQLRRTKIKEAALEDMLKKLTATVAQAATEEACSEEYDIMVSAIDFEAAAAIVVADDQSQLEASSQIYEAAQFNTMMAADDYYTCLNGM